MNTAAEDILNFLDAHGIDYEICEHEPVHTIEDCAPISDKIGALIPKNYFLMTRNRKNVYLCLVPPQAHFNSSSVSKQAGSSRLCFGDDGLLLRCLHAHAGAVSPLGLVFDTAGEVRLLLDMSLLKAERIAFHPCDNTVTLAMRTRDFMEVYLPAVTHIPVFVNCES